MQHKNNKNKTRSHSAYALVTLGLSFNIQGCSSVEKVAVSSYHVTKFAYRGVVGTTKTVYAGGKVLGSIATGTYKVGAAAVGGAVGASVLVYSGTSTAIKILSGTNNDNNRDHGSDVPNVQTLEPRCLHGNGTYSAAYKDAAGNYSC